MNALALAGQTLTAMGKRPAKEKADRSEWVVRGRTRNIFQRGKMQEADTACWEPFSTLSLSKQQMGVCCSPSPAGTVNFLSTQFLAWDCIHKTLMWKATKRYRGKFMNHSYFGELIVVLCDHLEGWGIGEKFQRERIYVYLWLIHIVVWQKPTHYCKAIILQLKKKGSSLVVQC